MCSSLVVAARFVIFTAIRQKREKKQISGNYETEAILLTFVAFIFLNPTNDTSDLWGMDAQEDHQ